MSGTPALTIRTGTHADAAALAAFGAETFRDTYAADVPAGALNAFIRRHFGVAMQSAELADPACRFLLAETGDDVVGYGLLRDDVPPPVAVRADRPLLLDRLYVASSAQGRGVGRALLAAVREEALARTRDVLWLSVWEHNHRAIAIYRHWGFLDVGGVAFDLAGEPQVDRVLVLSLEGTEPSHAAGEKQPGA